MHPYVRLALFLVLVVGGGFAIGLTFQPGEWYAGLAKPAFNPPNWLFAPVWTLIYILIAIAGWLVHRPALRPLVALWWLQLALNFAWTPTFFGAHRTGAALAVILALLVVIVVFIVRAWPVRRAAALLFLPYAAWVTFASSLNAAIWSMN